MAGITVDYVDHLGTDLSVVNAARVSFDKESKWEITGQGREEGGVDITASLADRDQKLIKYLAKHNHWTPFGHPQITLREKVPIFVARQRFKHTVGFVYNEVSRRYVDSKPEFYVPDVWRKRADDKKQGSTEEPIDLNTLYVFCEEPKYGWDDYTVLELLNEHYDRTELLYDTMIKKGVCPEQARSVLPISLYTEYVTTGSLAAFARTYKLRSEEHAQKEIQVLAEEWNKIIRPLFPVSWSALVD